MSDFTDFVFSGGLSSEPRKTLRDEFAMAALTGLLSHISRADWSQEEIVKEALSFANAMMAERARQAKGE